MQRLTSGLPSFTRTRPHFADCRDTSRVQVRGFPPVTPMTSPVV